MRSVMVFALMLSLVGAPAGAAPEKPEIWECAALAREIQSELYLEQTFGSLAKDNPFHNKNARPAAVLKPLIEKADARAQRWGGQMVLTDQQIASVRRLSPEARSKMLAACDATY